MSQDLAIKNLAHGTREQYLRCCCGFSRYEDFHAHVVFAMTPYPAESCAVGASAALLSVKRRLLGRQLSRRQRSGCTEFVVDLVRARATVKMSTDEIMALTRPE